MSKVILTTTFVSNLKPLKLKIEMEKVIFTYFDIKRRPEHDVQSHEVKNLAKILELFQKL